MSIKNLPLDAGRLGTALCVSVECKTDPETGVVKTDRDGVPVWTVGVAVRPDARRAALMEVAVSGEPEGIQPGMYVDLVEPEAFMWEMNGRSGLSFRAAKVLPAASPILTPPPAKPAADAAVATKAGAK
ncbi:hypothetical protein [Streptacidiphilus neutrinimicus]|uniref:hypothetical protein n=1 Tax=Streptacidiphilus neutrinimicus TaxID=105420 RepID=UPI000694ED49|nr:hypothetical protein [Streptacidiphilus neutrinimicus]